MNSSLQTLSSHHGLFSSQTAFKRPNISNKTFTVSSKSSQLSNLNKNLDQQTPTSWFGKRKDLSCKNLEPKKKIKTNCGGEMNIEKQVKELKSKEDYSKSVKLTIDEVFNTVPKETKQKTHNKLDFFDEDCDSASSLSFLSSDISFDDLEEESMPNHQTRSFEEASLKNIQVEARSSMDMPLISNPNNSASQINSIHFLHYLLCLEQQKQLQLSTNPWQQNYSNEVLSLHSRMNHLNGSLHQLQFPLTEHYSSLFSNTYHGYSQIDLKDNLIFAAPHQENRYPIDHSLREKFSLFEEGYDSDSKGTKSTNDDLDNTNMSPAGNFFKSFSPIESVSGEESESKTVISHFDNNKKQLEKKTSAKQPKEKKKEALNLKMNINPKNFVTHRRQNKLQLLRKSKDNKDTDEPVLTVENEIEPELQKNEEEDLRAIIPELGVRERRRPQVKSVWNPEIVRSKEIVAYLQRVCSFLEEEIINEEAALKFLTSNHIQIQKALEIIQANKFEFKEKFRIKARRERRPRFGF